MSSNFVIRHTLTHEQYAQYIRLFFNRAFRISRSNTLIIAVLLATVALIWDILSPLLFLSILFLAETFFLLALRAFLLSDYASKKYGQTSVRYVFSEDSIQIERSAEERPKIISFKSGIAPIETADALFLLTNNPLIIIVLPKFAFSPDSMKELRTFIEKKTLKEIRHA